MKHIKKALIFLIVVVLNACTMTPEQGTAVPKQRITAPEMEVRRTLILGGEEHIESEFVEFVAWKCSDYSSGENTLVEFGRALISDNYKNSSEYEKINDSEKEAIDEFIKMFGFVLYDGTNTGERALYSRSGLNHRWDWGPEGKYSFIIKPDGTGLFYDFTSAQSGESIKANDVYKCRKY